MKIKSLNSLLFFVATVIIFLFVLVKWGIPFEINNVFTVKKNQDIYIQSDVDKELDSLEFSLEKLDSAPSTLDDLIEN